MGQIVFYDNGMKGKAFRTNLRLIRTGRGSACLGEMTPFVFNGRLYLAAVGHPFSPDSCLKESSLVVCDAVSSELFSIFGAGYGFANAIVHDGTVHVFAMNNGSLSDGSNLIECFSSRDLKNWELRDVLKSRPDELLFNQSVCQLPNGSFLMAIEVEDNKTVPFTIYFARSRNLIDWEYIPGAIYGAEKYAACPAVRFCGGFYYLLYLEHRQPKWLFEMCLTRSRDLVKWEDAPLNPVLNPENCELCNASDVDLAEFNGQTHLFYCYGNQKGCGCVADALFDGSMCKFFESYYP